MLAEKLTLQQSAYLDEVSMLSPTRVDANVFLNTIASLNATILTLGQSAYLGEINILVNPHLIPIIPSKPMMYSCWTTDIALMG